MLAMTSSGRGEIQNVQNIQIRTFSISALQFYLLFNMLTHIYNHWTLGQKKAPQIFKRRPYRALT